MPSSKVLTPPLLCMTCILIFTPRLAISSSSVERYSSTFGWTNAFITAVFDLSYSLHSRVS